MTMPVNENPMVTTTTGDISKSYTTKRITCLTFLRGVTLRIACLAEAEFNLRHSNKTNHGFTIGEINATREQLIRQGTVELLQQLVTKQGKTYSKMVLVEKFLGHNCSCIFNKLTGLTLSILRNHPVLVNINYMGDMDRTRKNVYDSVMAEYDNIFLRDDKLLGVISGAFPTSTERDSCSGKRKMNEIVRMYSKLKR